MRKPRPLAVIRNRRLNSVALLAPLRSVQSKFSSTFKVQFGVVTMPHMPSAPNPKNEMGVGRQNQWERQERQTD